MSWGTCGYCFLQGLCVSGIPYQCRFCCASSVENLRQIPNSFIGWDGTVPTPPKPRNQTDRFIGEEPAYDKQEKPRSPKHPRNSQEGYLYLA